MAFATPATWKVHTLVSGPRCRQGRRRVRARLPLRAAPKTIATSYVAQSTGRIGRATSPDGLEWEVQHDGREGGCRPKAEDWFHARLVRGCGDVLPGDAWFLYTYGKVERADGAARIYAWIGTAGLRDGHEAGRVRVPGRHRAGPFEGDEADGGRGCRRPIAGSPVGRGHCERRGQTGDRRRDDESACPPVASRARAVTSPKPRAVHRAGRHRDAGGILAAKPLIYEAARSARDVGRAGVTWTKSRRGARRRKPSRRRSSSRTMVFRRARRRPRAAWASDAIREAVEFSSTALHSEEVP